MATCKVTYDMDGVRTYMIDGKVVTKKEFDAILPSKPISVPLAAHTPGAWPMVSEAMAVQSWQVEEAMAHDAKLGVPTEYDREISGPIFRDQAHRKAYLKAHGMRDNHGCYGD